MSEHQPIFTKPAGGAAAPARSVDRLLGEARLEPDADPDAVVDQILELLSREHYSKARTLASAALARFPDNSRVLRTWGIFDPRDKAKPSSVAARPSTGEDLDWLKDPPDWARGKWVALVGAKAVASADTLDELMEVLGSRAEDAQPPLAVRIDAA